MCWLTKKHLAKFNSGNLIFVGGDFSKWMGKEQYFITENKTDLKYLPEGNELDIIKSTSTNI